MSPAESSPPAPPSKPPAPGSAPPAAAKPLREDLRKDLAKLLVLALPGFFVNQLLAVLGLPFAGRPWVVAALLVPLAVGCWITWQLLKGRNELVLKGPFLWFFLCYVLLFWIAAGTGFFNWRRQLVGYEEQVPPNWLALDRLGDWRYRIAPRPAPRQDFLVILMPSPEGKTLEEVRYELTVFLQRAAQFGARGVGLDFFLELPSAVDPLLCRSIDAAWRRNMPVFLGTRHLMEEGLVVQPAVPESLAPCLTPDRLGHLAAYVEWDGRVRSMPLALGGDKSHLSLAYRIANQIEGGKIEAPESQLVQIIEPAGGVPVVRAESLSRAPGAWAKVRDRFLLVGRDTPADRYATPFGLRAGVLLHANTVQALRDGRWIRRLPWDWDIPAIFISCYLITALFAFDRPARSLLIVAGALSATTVLLAAAAMRIWLVWLDVSYPLVALWLLLALLLLLRWKRQRRPRPRRTSTAAAVG
jgi:CHASE2 domain-containing sensor protein